MSFLATNQTGLSGGDKKDKEKTVFNLKEELCLFKNG